MRSTNNKIKTLYFLIICFLFIKFLNALNILTISSNFYSVIWFFIAIVGGFITIEDFNYHKSNEKLETEIIILLIYLIVYFLMGLILGYRHNVYSNNTFSQIVWNFNNYILPIFFQEFIRNILCNYSNKSNKIKVFISIIYILININFSGLLNISGINESLLRFVCLNLIPLISVEFSLTYLCFLYGSKTSLIYKIMINLFNVYIPILPNVNFFLAGIFSTIVPVFIYFKLENENIEKLKEKPLNTKITKYKNYLFFFITVILVIFVIAKRNNYQLVAILSNSMNPLYYRGDAVVLRKMEDEEKKDLKIGDIIAFYDDKKIIVHRIVDISNQNEIKFITKGDNNLNNDILLLDKEDIIGKYIFHIKYLGYPPVLIYEMIKK